MVGRKKGREEGRARRGWEALDKGVNSVPILPGLNKQDALPKVRGNLLFPKGSALILSVLYPIKAGMPHSMVRTS